jgi:1-acyl-sn-glycerol-3-phosphate acyltransferase
MGVLTRIVGFLSRSLRVLLTGSAFLLFGLGACVLSWIVVPWICLRSGRDPAWRVHRCRAAISGALRLHVAYMRSCRLIDCDPRGIAARLPTGPFVLVANHPSLIDAVLILASHPSICCVAKGDLFRSPVIGRLLRSAAHIDAGDGLAGAGATVARGAIDRLRGGDPVLVFPEGTRSPARGLGRFKLGAFQIAEWAQVPLVPVLICASPPTLMRGIPWYTVPEVAVRFDLSVMPASEPAPHGEDVQRLCSDTHDLFERLIGNTYGRTTPAQRAEASHRGGSAPEGRAAR